MNKNKKNPWTIGQWIVLVFPLFVGFVVFALYREAATIGERAIYALIFAISTWLLTATLRWTFVWIEAVFKKE